MKKTTSGFTIVELLIVIVVIGILAAITIVAYNGVQARSRDATRKSDLAAAAKALEVRAVDYETALYSDDCTSSGANAHNSGWFSQAGLALNSGDYGSNSASTCLKNQSNTSTAFVDPTGARSCVSSAPSTCFAYLFCTVSTTTYIFAHLETESLSLGGLACGSSWASTFGMNYFVKASAY